MSENRVPQEDQNRLVYKIYNKRDGVCASTSEVEFRERALAMSELAYKHMPERWDDLQEKLWKYVVVPRIVCPNIALSWKTNFAFFQYCPVTNFNLS